MEFSPEETELLFPYLHTEKDDVVIRLLDVVGLRGGPEAIKVAQELTTHSNPEVASAANLTIRRLYARFPEGA
jgi:hypothetical protein